MESRRGATPMGLRLNCMNPDPRVAKAQPGAGIIQRFQRIDVVAFAFVEFRGDEDLGVSNKTAHQL